jgi:hypothetical protein
VVEVALHEGGGVGEVGGWYTLAQDCTDFAPQYHEEVIL